jgi:hypothetical protein
VLITNYTSTDEYLIYPGEQKCEKYGADAMYPWGYGNGGMAYVGPKTVRFLKIFLSFF